MKATLVLMLVLCLLLPGCAADVPEATETSTSEATTVPPVPETQPSLYDPKAPVEQQTAGAVRAYPLDENCSGIAFMGKQLLLFFNDGFGPTLLSRLDGDNERVEQTVELSGSVPFGNVQVTDKKCAYYSTLENCVIVLDDSLRESFRVSLPEGMVGAPVIREDMTEAYYCTGTEIRAVNLETGLSRLLRQRDCLQLSVDAVLFQDTVLQCTVTEADGLSYTEFFSADTGESLGSDADLLMMDSWASDYLLLRTEGAIQECVFVTVGGVINTNMN